MAHVSKFLDYTVNCFIVNSNRVLLIYNKKYNMWLAPGGHIEPDESLEDTIYREIEEETGISKKDLVLLDPRNSTPNEDIFDDHKGAKNIVSPTFVDIHEASPGHTHIAFRYFLTTNSDIKGSSDESVTKHKWLSKNDLNSDQYLLKKAVKFYANYALELSRK